MNRRTFVQSILALFTAAAAPALPAPAWTPMYGSRRDDMDDICQEEYGIEFLGVKQDSRGDAYRARMEFGLDEHRTAKWVLLSGCALSVMTKETRAKEVASQIKKTLREAQRDLSHAKYGDARKLERMMA